MSVRRDTNAKAAIKTSELLTKIPEMLDTIHNDMFARADKAYRERRRVVTVWEDFTKVLNEKCTAVIPWCENEPCEDEIKERSARV